MGRWPNFLLLGAARAGTTALYLYLSQHPDVFMSKVKEPHFFAPIDQEGERQGFLWMKVITDKDAYLKLFDEAGDKIVAGEASTGYLYDRDAPRRIFETIPSAKMACILRDPIQRAYSHYVLNVTSGTQKRSFLEALEEDYARPRKEIGHAYLYIERGLYYQQVKRYFDLFGRDHVRVYLHEDLETEPLSVLRDLWAFLSLSAMSADSLDLSSWNRSYSPRHPIVKSVLGNRYARGIGRHMPDRVVMFVANKLLFKASPKPPVDAAAADFMRKLAYDDVRRLEGLINRDLSHWL